MAYLITVGVGQVHVIHLTDPQSAGGGVDLVLPVTEFKVFIEECAWSAQLQHRLTVYTLPELRHKTTKHCVMPSPKLLMTALFTADVGRVKWKCEIFVVFFILLK